MPARNDSSKPLFLGLDLSTQSLTATLITETLKVIHVSTVNFERDLPNFEAVQRCSESVTSPTAMFLAALDLVLSKMSEADASFSRIFSLSASAQQHGSVYWNRSSANTLANLNPELTLYDQLESAFTIANGPIWMDSSTTKECRELEKAMGGSEKLAELTGSRAYERFTGPQIMKIRKEKAEQYQDTHHVSLISSFLASLFLGKYAPEDAGDGSGMNLMNIHSNPPQWETQCLTAVDPSGSLAPKLCSAPVLPHTVVGTVCSYFCARYGFSPSCKVVAFSGDNCNTVVGLGLRQEGDWLVSLGTSDVVCTVTEKMKVTTTGHVFRSPMGALSYLPLVCYSNGSLTRQAVRDGNCVVQNLESDTLDKSMSWDDFDKKVFETSKASCVGLFHQVPEICPRAEATEHPLIYEPELPLRPLRRKLSHAELCRAVVESRALAIYTHGNALNFGKCRRIIAGGGASASKSMLQCLADVVGCPVYVVDDPNNGGAAAFGAAIRALHGKRCEEQGSFVSFEDIWASVKGNGPQVTVAAEPDMGIHRRYVEELVPVYRAAEGKVQNCSRT